MYCRYCGAIMTEEAKDCSACGKPVDAPQTNPDPNQAPPRPLRSILAPLIKAGVPWRRVVFFGAPAIALLVVVILLFGLSSRIGSKNVVSAFSKIDMGWSCTEDKSQKEPFMMCKPVSLIHPNSNANIQLYGPATNLTSADFFVWLQGGTLPAKEAMWAEEFIKAVLPGWKDGPDWVNSNLQKAIAVPGKDFSTKVGKAQVTVNRNGLFPTLHIEVNPHPKD